jgi:uncharacterized repeat protein (TIGR03803 family)
VSFSTLVSLRGTDGAQPYGVLTLGADGNFYGTTSAGGAHGRGTVFSMTHAGALTTLASFDGTNGAQPMAALIQGTNGNFFGTASAGGANGQGTVFSMTPGGMLTCLASFGGTNGAQPLGGLVQSANGMFYGTTAAGGTNDMGTVFAVTSTGALTTVSSFAGANGAHPSAGLTLGNDGNLYGTTAAGGAYGSGTVFQVTTNGRITLLHSFGGTGDGSGPQARLLKAADGGLYGTTAGGGTNDTVQGGDGTVFRVTLGGGYSVVASFNGTNGARPFAELAQGSDGTFYGTTLSGSTNGSGAVFAMTSGGAITNLYAFTGGTDGANAAAGLTAGTNGNFYGVTAAGGRGQGTLYELSAFLPFILSQPADLTVPTNTTVSFAVTAGGSAPLSYQWLFNSNRLADGGRISGSTTPALTISNAVPTDAGTYAVIVSNPAGWVTSSYALLRVINPYPALTISTPARNAVVNSLTLTAAGTAKGDLAVARVYVQLNQTGWQLATTTNSWTNWTATLSPPPGTNLLQAYAENIVGTDSLTNSVSFVCGVTGAVVTVRLNGQGSVSPNYNGQTLVIGRPYSMGASAARGYYFAGWTGDLATNTSRLSFVLRSNLAVQANFVPNPFTGVKGTYNGLWQDTNGVASTSSGFFTFTVTDKGKLSGSVQMAGGRYSMSGQFDASGRAGLTITRLRLSPLRLELQLDITQGTDQVTGTLSDGAWVAELAGDRAVFDGQTRVSPQAGRYTLAVPGGTNASAEPGGDGYGTISVDNAGKARLTATLADGTRFSQAVSVSKHGAWPLFAKLYGGGGLIMSWLSFAPTTASDLSGEAAWIKPAKPGDKYYPGGFNRQPTVLGSRYQAPAAGNPVLNFTNAQVDFIGGDLTRDFTNQVALDTRNRVTNLSSNRLTLFFSVSVGSFRGSVTDPATARPISFTGVVLQKPNRGAGFFLGTDQSGKVVLETQ